MSRRPTDSPSPKSSKRLLTTGEKTKAGRTTIQPKTLRQTTHRFCRRPEQNTMPSNDEVDVHPVWILPIRFGGRHLGWLNWANSQATASSTDSPTTVHALFIHENIAPISCYWWALPVFWQLRPQRGPKTSPPLNVVFVLCDDHRFDCFGAAGHPFLETPHIDAMAKDGAMLTRAYVTTSLCSHLAGASILTGQYAHNHRVVDNYHPVDTKLVFFPQHLQKAGYQTAFVGKWHMGGDTDDAQRGFDHWGRLQRPGDLLA